MKSTLSFLLMILVIQLHAQTAQIEEYLLNEGIKEGKWSAEEVPDIAKKWRSIRGKYPIMQYDSVDGQVVVEDVIHYPGVNKPQAFRRLKEWAATNFTEVASVVKYEDFESGKIIFKGYTEITSYVKVRFLWDTEMVPTTSNLYFTLIITAKDEKAKVRFENLSFKNYRVGYSVGSYYVPSEWDEISLKSFFPVVYKKPGTWEAAFGVLENANKALKWLAPSMERHIKSLTDDYRF